MDIEYEDGIWTVAMDWSAVDETAAADHTPVERALSTVAERGDLPQDQLRSSIVRTTEDGMSVVVVRDE
jgi:hypothetical protein